jgi:hypothetical protein
LKSEDENPDDSIRINREFDSNEIDEGNSQFEKQFEQRISILDGITRSDEFEKE